jgi:uncharacterized protein YndB with AHSA1/START domain
VRIRYPDGTEVAGAVEEIVAPDRLVFTYGYVAGSTCWRPTDRT